MHIYIYTHMQTHTAHLFPQIIIYFFLLDYKFYNWSDHVSFIFTKTSPTTIEEFKEYLWNKCMNKNFLNWNQENV